MQKLIIASTSTLYGGSYLDYLMPEIADLFSGCAEILFIAYARPGGISEDDYTAKVREAFKQININVRGLHEFDNPAAALTLAKGIFTGGGNTFLLVKQLHEKNLMAALAASIAAGIPYLGTSAGSNIAGQTMQTTNDMPIVYPSSFSTLGILPFNLNPHYIEYPASTHMGETRQTRIAEFHQFNEINVIGLREGSWISVNGEAMILHGILTAKLFRKGFEPDEVATGTDLAFLK